MKEIIESNNSTEKIVANLSEANTAYFWEPLKINKSVLCRKMTGASGFPSIINSYDLLRLQELSKKSVLYKDIKILYLRQSDFIFPARTGLTIIITPSWARLRLWFGHAPFVQSTDIDGRRVSAIAIGDIIPFKLTNLKGGYLELTVIEC